MSSYLFLIPLFPLVAFAINLLFGRKYIKDKAHWIAAPAVFVSWFISLLVLYNIHDKDQPLSQHLFTWIPSGNFIVDVNLYADQLTAIMLMVVTSVSFLVHVYSIGYMHKDPGYYRFFSYLPLFVFSMLMLVLAENYLLTLCLLGSRRSLLIPPHRVLVQTAFRGQCGQEGVHRQPNW